MKIPAIYDCRSDQVPFDFIRSLYRVREGWVVMLLTQDDQEWLVACFSPTKCLFSRDFATDRKKALEYFEEVKVLLDGPLKKEFHWLGEDEKPI